MLLVSTVRLRNNLSLNANYTWSHCIGLPDIAAAGTVLNPGQNYFHQGYGQNIGALNRSLDVGNCEYDRRHVANVSLVYQTPRFSNNTVRRLASGWNLSSIIVAQSGAPYTLVSGTTPDPATGFGGNPPGDQRLNFVGGSAVSATQGQACANIAPCISWLSSAAFSAPALGTFGNMNPYNLIGPSLWEWDQMLSRQFQIGERRRIDIRAEAYNVTNSLRLGTPGTTLSSGTFGLVTADATPPGPTTAPARVWQFALKYMF